MIANIYSLEKYCTDYQNIDNYEEAVKSPLRYDLHHRREISENKSRKQLIAEELIFIEAGEHIRLHKEGKNLSAESRQKISESQKGNHYVLGHHWNLSDETRQKISAAKKGKNLSEETRKKMSDAKKGKPSHWKGKPKSVETRKKMSEAHSGKHWHLENGHRIWTE